MATTERGTKRTRMRFEAVWLLPILAALAVGWMIYDTQASKGEVIRLQFESAVGIVSGKTAVRYKGVQIGTVRAIDTDIANGSVIIECQLDSDADAFAREGARFWIQYPQIGLDGVKSLDTLISGPYIAASPGEGGDANEFVGSLIRPSSGATPGDLRVTLLAASIDSVRRDSPVLYRGIEVGYVDEVAVEPANGEIRMIAIIRAEFAGLVRADSYFWEVSGYEIAASLTGGLRLESSSLRSIINGGIAFENPPNSTSEPAPTDPTFALHTGKQPELGPGVPIEVTFARAEGIVPGVTPIRHRGVEVGLVTDVKLATGLQSVLVSGELRPTYRDLAREQSLYWIVRPEIDLSGIREIDAFAGGTYIAVSAGSGNERVSFTGLEQKPNRPDFGPGLDLVLQAESSNNVRRGSPVFYKQITVGRVTAVDVTRSGNGVRVYVNIDDRYAPLVRRDSVFWSVSGARVSTGLADLELEFETIEAILIGGLAFATPPQQAGSATLSDGASFTVADEARDAWLNWQPGLDLGNGF